jgi:hypothetical protein
VSGLENLDFFTEKSLVDDRYDYYGAIRRCPIWREPAHGVVMVPGYDEAVAVQRDADQTLSVCNIVSGQSVPKMCPRGCRWCASRSAPSL